MGYGVSLTTMLLSIGVGTAMSSAVVHFSEVFTSLVSGSSHFRIGNFDKKIFKFLAIPGIIGGVFGAYVAVRAQNLFFLRPAISFVLLFLGFLIIVKFLNKNDPLKHTYDVPRIRKLMPLGFIAAFIDAIGGGGWGPITTPTLIAGNGDPKKTIGSVNAAEFFITLSISATFLLSLRAIDWKIVFPLLLGGIIAAPIAALLTNKLPEKIVGISVGISIIILSLRTILISFGILS